MYLILLKIWVWVKCLRVRLLGKKGINAEKNILKQYQIYSYNYDQLKNFGYLYASDRLFGFIPWDWQYNVVDMFNREFKIDCGVHRYAQLISSTYHESLLITYLANPISQSHVFCINKIDTPFGIQYEVIDYYHRYISFSTTLDETIQYVLSKKRVKIHAWIAQNLQWQIVDGG